MVFLRPSRPYPVIFSGGGGGWAGVATVIVNVTGAKEGCIVVVVVGGGWAGVATIIVIVAGAEEGCLVVIVVVVVVVVADELVMIPTTLFGPNSRSPRSPVKGRDEGGGGGGQVGPEDG